MEKPPDTDAIARPTDAPQMERGIGMVQATAMNMANMVGIGPFITIPLLMTGLAGPQALIAWGVALIIALADGLVWSELGAAMPGSGGTYQFLREGFGRERWGRLMSFLFIWQFLFSGPLEIASGFIGFASYLKFLWPNEHGVKIAAAGAGLLAIFLLYRPIRNIGRVMVVLWVGSLLTVGIVIFTGAMHFDAKKAFDLPPDAWVMGSAFFIGLGASCRVGMYDYLGYYNVCHLGDEVRQPGKVIPRSVLLSLVAVALLYAGIHLSVLGVVSWRDFAPVPRGEDPKPVVSMMMTSAWGPGFAQFFTYLVLFTALASCVAGLLGYSRIPFAAARDGNFFKVFARLHPKGAFPYVSLLVVGLMAVGFTFLPLMWVIDGLFTTRIVVQFCGQIVALMLLRKHRPDLVRPFKMWLYPLPAFVAFGGWMFFLVTTDMEMLAYGAAVVVAGVVAFLMLSKITGRWPFASAENPAGR
jgi:amino acid transporter